MLFLQVSAILGIRPCSRPSSPASRGFPTLISVPQLAGQFWQPHKESSVRVFRVPRKEGTKSIYRARKKQTAIACFPSFVFLLIFLAVWEVGEDEEKANGIVLIISF